MQSLEFRIEISSKYSTYEEKYKLQLIQRLSKVLEDINKTANDTEGHSVTIFKSGFASNVEIFPKLPNSNFQPFETKNKNKNEN